MGKVLVIGGGGREHALAWKFSGSPHVDKVFVAPGNPGMESVAEIVSISPFDFDSLVNFVKSESISLTVVGPEAPLMEGIADRFHEEGLRIFAPRANAAIIEGSKLFTKKIMEKYKIPTAKYESFSDYNKACGYIKSLSPPFVIKADGLAQGKGVCLADSEEEACKALYEMMIENCFGDSGKTVVIEEFLCGTEFSHMAFVHGENVIPLMPAMDHKRAYDKDKGPNTGGMGAFAPVAQISGSDISTSIETILKPMAKAMSQEGRPFTGILYAGLIATSEGPKVIEFNARFGDPEAEVVLPLLDSDLYTVFIDLLNGKIPPVTWSKDSAIGVVLASRGYPGKYETGFPISGLDDLDSDTTVFHSATDKTANGFTTNGGRVLVVVRRADSLPDARETLYREIEKIKCENIFFRTDIGG